MKDRIISTAALSLALTGCGRPDGDVNGNGCVDLPDLIAAQTTDVNRDGIVSLADVEYVQARYGRGCNQLRTASRQTDEASVLPEVTTEEYSHYSLLGYEGAYEYNIGLWVAKLSDPHKNSIQEEINYSPRSITGNFTLKPGETMNFVDRFGQNHFGRSEGYRVAPGARGNLIYGSGMCPLAHAWYKEALAHGMNITLAKMLHPPMPGFTLPHEKGISIYSTDKTRQNLEFMNPYPYPVTFHFQFVPNGYNAPGTFSIAVSHEEA